MSLDGRGAGAGTGEKPSGGGECRRGRMKFTAKGFLAECYVPKGAKVVGTWHTHPWYDFLGPSGPDRMNAAEVYSVKGVDYNFVMNGLGAAWEYGIRGSGVGFEKRIK
jgi:hypothetical protein